MDTRKYMFEYVNSSKGEISQANRASKILEDLLKKKYVQQFQLTYVSERYIN